MPTPDTVTIQVDLPGVADYEPNPNVGNIYEIAINGVGYMLDNDPQDPSYERGSVPLLPERLATSETPFSENINRYTFYAQSLFEGGEGQDYGNRDDSDPRKYADGSKVDPFDEEGTIRIGPAVSELYDTSGYSSPRMVLVGGTLYVQVGDDDLAYNSGGGWATLSGITDPGAITITDLTSDGNQWYAATGGSVVRGTTSNPAGAWSSQDAEQVQWAAGRIMAAVKGASSTTPNIFTSLNDSGAEENTGGHLALPDGHTVELGGATQGFYYFAGYSGTTGAIYAWQLGLNDSGAFHTPFEAWRLPEGSTLVDVSTGGGSVWIQVAETGDNDRVMYRGIPNERGHLQIVRVSDVPAGGSNPSVGFEWDHKMMFLWPTRSIAAVGLKYGGLAKFSDDIGSGNLVDMEIWQGKLHVSDSAGKVWVLDGVATSGWFTTPIFDGDSNLDKVWDDVTVACEPLSAGESIKVEYSTDHGNSFNEIGTVNTPGATRYIFDLGVTAQALQLRVTLQGPGTSTPVLSVVSARLHPLGLVDGAITLPVLTGDEIEGLNGQILPESKRGRGATMARELEALAGQRVLFQDVDWKYLQLTEIYEVLSVRTRAVWLRQKNAPKLQSVTYVTMQRKVTR